jgi:hypothetical protein
VGIVDDGMQISSALLGGPTDHLIARFGFPSACTEADYGDDLSGGTYEVTQLRPRQGLMAEIMMTFDVGVPQRRVGFLHDEINCELTEIHRRDVCGLKHRALDVRMCPALACAGAT